MARILARSNRDYTFACACILGFVTGNGRTDQPLHVTVRRPLPLWGVGAPRLLPVRA